MNATGRCHCGAIRYEVSGEFMHHALCHCGDCRRASGAPAVSWAMFAQQQVRITGTPKVYSSSADGRRHFCAECGSSLFYTNERIFPGLIDIQSATLDDPGALQLQAEIQTAERIRWMPAAQVPQFERYPPGPE